MAKGEITRTQIPIDPLFAALEHEVAGQHFTSVLIDMKDGLKDFSTLYSVLSRMENGSQCWITEQANFERFEVYLTIVSLTLYASEVLCNPAGSIRPSHGEFGRFVHRNLWGINVMSQLWGIAKKQCRTPPVQAMAFFKSGRTNIASGPKYPLIQS
ncbi:hypothetical protein F5876DRAFT_65543 [Lentinula aff. lateritia]|uniref:Uncharacterized protein n=1 Tax=Lentinula aff. lateritia TaxID=2804960 RepID=A0ACC1U1B1_9AGAR|nr:hypothetical protein F5876DRAFT_65543 [Lentinula aff. lateritia]